MNFLFVNFNLFTGRAYSPGPRKERLALLQRAPAAHHSKLVLFSGTMAFYLIQCYFVSVYKLPPQIQILNNLIVFSNHFTFKLISNIDVQCNKPDSNVSPAEKLQISEMRSYMNQNPSDTKLQIR